MLIPSSSQWVARACLLCSLQHNRHSKASHWLDKDKLNVIEVQHLLGHEQLDTTMRYVDTDEGQLADAVLSIEHPSESGGTKKWKRPDGTLRGFCGL
jgi:site-specific recombinase XerC